MSKARRNRSRIILWCVFLGFLLPNLADGGVLGLFGLVSELWDWITGAGNSSSWAPTLFFLCLGGVPGAVIGLLVGVILEAIFFALTRANRSGLAENPGQRDRETDRTKAKDMKIKVTANARTALQ